MNTILKTTWAMAAATVLFTGCSVEDTATSLGDSVSDNTGGGSNGTGSATDSGLDTFTITKTALGFTIDWVKNSEGYSEVIYREVGSDDLRGNGYPLTHNSTGSYRTTCEKYSDDGTRVWYGCERDDVTYASKVIMEKGVEYEWMSSYGTEHELAEAEVHMEYVGDTLTIE